MKSYIEQLDAEELKYSQIFAPGLVEALQSVQDEKMKFVYYTNAETAKKVLQNAEIWFRNSMVMNDFSEITYGLDLIRLVLFENEGANFQTAIDDIFAGTFAIIQNKFPKWVHDWEYESYLACVSVHYEEESESGRLSMWRAYGDTALVINNTPLIQATDKLGVYSYPVLYLSKDDFLAHVQDITDQVLLNRTYLKSLNQETLIGYIHRTLFRLAIGTKHPGFSEEEEWRLYFRPTDQPSEAMTLDTVVIDGIPQKIFKLRLAHSPEIGLYHADIPSLLDRIIIGPTQYPYVVFSAFGQVLTDLGMPDVEEKLTVSDIPLRAS